MKAREVIKLFEEQKEIPLSPRQEKWGVTGVEGIAFYDIDPQEFLKLTTDNSGLSWSQKKKSIDFYLSPEVQKDMATAPCLYINPEGKVISHEGRHRALAVKDAGGDKFRVVLVADKIDFDDVSRFGWRWKRNLPLPEYLLGQFTDYKHKIDLSRITYIDRSKGHFEPELTKEKPQVGKFE